VEWWGKAGERAVHGSAYNEAIAHLEKALGLPEELAEGPTQRLLRLRLQTAYGYALLHGRGHAEPLTTAAFARARDLAAGVQDAIERFSAYWGIWVGSLWRAQLTPMREAAEAFLSDAKRSPGSPELGIANRIFGITCWFQGDYAGARLHLEQALAAYDNERDRVLVSRFGYDAGVVAMVYLALVLWPRGDLNRAASLLEEALSLALRSRHVPTIANAHAYTCAFAAIARKPVHVTPHADSLVSIAREHGFPLWLAHGTYFHGWASWCAGDREGETGMREGLARLGEMHIHLFEPLTGTLLAEAEAEAGCLEGGLGTLDTQIVAIEQSGQHWFDAEVHRVRGELLLRREQPDPAAAEMAFIRAIEIARTQKTRTFELRAALSLARLHQTRGRHQAARKLLLPAPVGFGESPELPEVAEANRLLASLD
jgi:predicted ATPase